MELYDCNWKIRSKCRWICQNSESLPVSLSTTQKHSAVRDIPHIWDHTMGVFNIRSMGWSIETVHDHVCFGPTKISSHIAVFLTWPCRISLAIFDYLTLFDGPKSLPRTFEKNPWANRQTIILDWVRWISNGNSDSDLQRLNSKKK